MDRRGSFAREILKCEVDIMAEEQQQNGCSPSDCAGFAHAESCSSKPWDFRKPANEFSDIKKVIGVVSGTYSSICIATELWFEMKIHQRTSAKDSGKKKSK